MAFSADELAAINAVLDPWCEARVPILVRDQLVLQYRVTRHDVLLFEKRPAFRRLGEWTESSVLKFRFDRRSGLWRLLWRDGNLDWHLYDLVEPTPRLDALLRHVDDDPTGIFWG